MNERIITMPIDTNIEELTATEELTAEEVAALVADAPTLSSGEAFCPTDAAGVDWVLRKMNAARAEATVIRQNAELMARACERQADALEWQFGPAIQTWLRAEIDGGKKKSVRLYHGIVGLRTKPAGVSITDPAAALAWAQEFLPDAVAVRLDKKALADALLTSGEAVDFATLNREEEVFYIK
jgi:hypothetical protein